MRVVLSRKGFDTTAGGCPSPIVAGRPLSLPIPTRMPTRFRYCDLAAGVGEVVEQLTRGRHARQSFCHLDPDLDASTLPRAAGWPASNTVYVAREALNVGGEEWACPGWGLFARGLRYDSWSADGHPQAAARGQEFVADIGERVDAREWVRGLFAAALVAPV